MQPVGQPRPGTGVARLTPSPPLDGSVPLARPTWKPRPGHIVAYGGVLALLALMAFGLVKTTSGPLESGPAPDFTLVGYDGRTVTLSQLRGNVVIVNFWASWCLPCREEAAYLERTWREYRDRGVVFIGVDWVDTEREAIAYIQEFDVTYVNGPDIGERIADAYRIRGVPETFFIDQAGLLQGVKIGPLSPPELDERIDQLLTAGASTP